MLFEGFSVDNRNDQYSADPWPGHPFHLDNNVNGVDGDPQGTGGGRAVHTLLVPEITAIQEAYVRRVVDAVNDLDNVLYEIGNELYENSVAWQVHMIDLIHSCEGQKAKQHPVGMTGGGPVPAIPNAALLASPAEWVSPRHEEGQAYRDDPPAADGSKVILSDTDHLWGLGATQGWVWKSFTRGLNPILMDPYEKLHGLDAFPSWGRIHARDHPFWEPIRRSLGYTLRWAQRVDLAAMSPRGDLVSSGYCLADPGRAYLAYLPDGGKVSIDLADTRGMMAVEWFSPTTGATVTDAPLEGGAVRHLGAPFGGDAVMYVQGGALAT
jgi:hypothetical protein